MRSPVAKPDLRGVTVATVLPFNHDLSIDWDGYTRVLDYCACPDGIAAACARLLQDDDLRAALTGAAYELFRERFAEDVVTGQVEALARKVAGQS